MLAMFGMGVLPKSMAGAAGLAFRAILTPPEAKASRRVRLEAEASVRPEPRGVS